MTKALKHALVALLATFALVGSSFTVGVTEAEAAGPCRVTGYSTHAKLRMAERDWSEAEVRETVRVECAYGVRQSNGNWRYTSYTGFRPTVILATNGTVVTVLDASAGGGGGGGSWVVGRATYDA